MLMQIEFITYQINISYQYKSYLCYADQKFSDQNKVKET